MQVLLEVVGVKRIRSIGLVSVLQPDGSAVLIIEVYQEAVRGLRATTALRRPCLGDDLGAVQRVVVDRTAVCLDGSDAIGVIREGIQELSSVHGHLHEFSTVPLQRIPVVGGGVADGVILIYCRTDLCQPVAGIIVRLGRGFVTRCARRIRICFLIKPIACVVIGVHVGLVQVRVILPRQLSRLIVGIPDGPGGCLILVSDSGDVPDGVIDIGVPGGGVTYNRFTGTDQAGGASWADLLVLITHRLGEACIFIRRGGFLRQAVHAVVPVRYGRPVVQTATENLQLGQRADAASVSAGSAVVIRIPVAYSIIVVRFAEVVRIAHGIAEGGLHIVRSVQVIIPDEALGKVGVGVLSDSQLRVPDQLTAAVVAVLILPPALGAFQGMDSAGGCVGIDILMQYTLIVVITYFTHSVKRII